MGTFQLLMLFAAVGAFPRGTTFSFCALSSRLIPVVAPLPRWELPVLDGRDEILQRSGDVVVVVAVLLLDDHVAKLVHERVVDVVDR